MLKLKMLDGCCDKNGNLVLLLRLSDGTQEVFNLSYSDVLAFLNEGV